MEGLEPCRRILAEAEREKKGLNRRGYNPGFGFLDHRHRVLAAVLSRRNTVTLTLAARLLGRDRNTLSYRAHQTMPRRCQFVEATPSSWSSNNCRWIQHFQAADLQILELYVSVTQRPGFEKRSVLRISALGRE